MCCSNATCPRQISSIRIADIHRPDLTNSEKIGPSITDVEYLFSYNWIESSTPTIAVPGCPSLWSPRKTSKKVAKDSGLIYIAQNAVRYSESPFEPLFRSLYIENPLYNIRLVDLITDRNNIHKLLSFINLNLSKNGLEPFTIDVEVTNNTAIFCRMEAETYMFIGPYEFRGYGHEFKKAFTTTQVSASTGHYRIISYNFGDLKFIVRYETDAYVDEFLEVQSRNVELEIGSLLSMMKTLSLSQLESRSRLPAESKLVMKEEGKQVLIQSTLEIKTRVSQTPNLVRAYHKGGLFEPPEEEDHASDLRGLVILIKEIIRVARENDGNAVIKYDGRSDNLEVWRRNGSKMLPDDLYSKLDTINPSDDENTTEDKFSEPYLSDES
ncbi:hypothetical protein BDV37DRAFT_269785 [Aspergillus pseudonomiae]|uniref:Geranylgeranyl pyrophosphate synthetase n=1 Tax=Aspergillus pseudonomiae TaxID=1506151 RepID=A0A5N7DLA0_9EURO|nr:uncharacterized protein BDV37DRAFT_269785 [Aspergillus pseudonomiae]KAE8406753.1 hypothetical protein BDV37DRAFT_269785 [Aspergillus pseudonomiae]